MVRGWMDIPALVSKEERLYYPVHKRMRVDYRKAVNRRYIPIPHTTQ